MDQIYHAEVLAAGSAASIELGFDAEEYLALTDHLPRQVHLAELLQL